jgi:hypothetical protein
MNPGEAYEERSRRVKRAAIIVLSAAAGHFVLQFLAMASALSGLWLDDTGRFDAPEPFMPDTLVVILCSPFIPLWAAITPAEDEHLLFFLAVVLNSLLWGCGVYLAWVLLRWFRSLLRRLASP